MLCFIDDLESEAMGIFDLYGLPVNPLDMRALSENEIWKLQCANMAAMQQAAVQPYQAAAMTNWLFARRPDDKPLDERFADFKVRLAAAIAKQAKTSPNT